MSDHWAVMEVLTAFVRQQAPAETLPPDKTSGEKKTKESPHELKPPADIEAILTVIGRRTRTFENGEVQRLDLHNTNLQGAYLADAQLQGAILERAQLQRAYLRDAQLQGAILERAQLQRAYLLYAQLQAKVEGAQFKATDLRGAQLQGANLRDAQLRGAYLEDAQLQDAHLERTQLQATNLKGAQHLTQDQINKACTDENTKLPEGLIRPAPCPAKP